MSDRVLVIGMIAVVTLVIIVFIIALGVEEKPQSVVTHYYDEPAGTTTTSSENNNPQNPDFSLIEQNQVEMASSYVKKLIANNDLDGLFNIMNYDYKRMLFDNQTENFAEFIEKEYPSGDIKVENTRVNGRNLYLYCSNKNSEQKVISVMNFKDEDSHYDIQFGEYLGSWNIDGIYQDKNVLIYFTNQIDYYDDTSVVMKITNLTDTKQKIDFSGSYLKSMPNIKRNKSYTNKNDNICEVDAKSSCIFELSFDKMTMSVSYIGLNFRINDADQVYSKEISLNEELY